jgi:hypothetical protein
VHAGSLWVHSSLHGCRVECILLDHFAPYLSYAPAASLGMKELAPEPEMDVQLVRRSRIRKILDGRLAFPPDQMRRLHTSSITITCSIRGSTELRNGISRWSTCDRTTPPSRRTSEQSSRAVFRPTTIRGKAWLPAGSHKSNPLVEPPDLVEPTSIRRHCLREANRRSSRRYLSPWSPELRSLRSSITLRS